MNKKMDNDFKWFIIGMIGVMLSLGIMTFAPNEGAQRIAACMTQQGMQYVDGNCIPFGSNDVSD